MLDYVSRQGVYLFLPPEDRLLDELEEDWEPLEEPLLDELPTELLLGGVLLEGLVVLLLGVLREGLVVLLEGLALGLLGVLLGGV